MRYNVEAQEAAGGLLSDCGRQGTSEGDWLLDLDEESRKIVGRDIATAEFGWPVGMPLARSLGDGLHEIRSNITNKRIARVMFTVHKKKMVLLHGFVKKSQKTPKADLDLAKKRAKEIES